jgi:Domain of unknown function (DUF4430)
VRTAAAAVLVAASLAGCGTTQTKGRATLWITRDRGAKVMLVAKVKAGQTAMQALQGAAKAETGYGGRFVQSIDGLEGSRTAERDWFYFINGYEADRGAADYKLHPGDVEWWDYRLWKNAIHVPVVVGAFPEPFLHGYGGKTRKATIIFDSPALEPQAKKLSRLIHAEKLDAAEVGDANVLFLTRADVPLSATTSRPGAPVRFVLGPAAARRLLEDPASARYRYSGLK